MQFRHVHLDPRARQSEIEHAIDELSASESVHGIFIQLPLPPHVDRAALFDRIPAEKDVDGAGAISRAKLARGDTSAAPATPSAIVAMLVQHGVRLRDAATVIVGDSLEIAVPPALLLKRASNAGSVRLVGPDVPALAAITREADILVSAASRPGSIAAEHVRPGATVVDAGYNRTRVGVVGDVESESIMGVAGAFVPMPGGIGPATVATLLEKTWASARRSSQR